MPSAALTAAFQAPQTDRYHVQTPETLLFGLRLAAPRRALKLGGLQLYILAVHSLMLFSTRFMSWLQG